MTTRSEAQGSAQKRTLSATEAMVGWFRKREKERRESKFLVVGSEAQRCSFFLLVWKNASLLPPEASVAFLPLSSAHPLSSAAQPIDMVRVHAPPMRLAGPVRRPAAAAAPRAFLASVASAVASVASARNACPRQQILRRPEARRRGAPRNEP